MVPVAPGDPPNMGLPQQHRDPGDCRPNHRLAEAPPNQAFRNPTHKEGEPGSPQHVRGHAKQPRHPCIKRTIAAPMAEKEQRGDQSEGKLSVKRIRKMQKSERQPSDSSHQQCVQRCQELTRQCVDGQQIQSGEHEIGEPKTRPDLKIVATAHNPLMRCYDQGQERRVLDSLDLFRLVKQPVTFPFGQCGPEHVIGAGIPPQVDRPIEARDPDGYPDKQEHSSARQILPTLNVHAQKRACSCMQYQNCL